MATTIPSEVKRSSGKPKGKKTGLAKQVKNSSSVKKKQVKAEKLWWTTAKKNRVVILVALLNVILQLYRLLVPAPSSAAPTQYIFVEQVQKCSVIVNNNIRPSSAKR